ncbi:uncharacterized protein DSM5745_07064 [Aspergillus mulundensis]|uniref:Uncharacterized protein n=1 Tax=Aspergillus mulundensis TaxID=1810919 RepID=A0A3D8RK27_9EURO|nr:hypothetical protein DSM5745_07064 [Aspergillus mulundensis]RDW74402.1 hypothetical protein DSM5745_07064 [Aspergillus mulundensis]
MPSNHSGVLQPRTPTSAKNLSAGLGLSDDEVHGRVHQQSKQQCLRQVPQRASFLCYPYLRTKSDDRHKQSSTQSTGFASCINNRILMLSVSYLTWASWLSVSSLPHSTRPSSTTPRCVWHAPFTVHWVLPGCSSLFALLTATVDDLSMLSTTTSVLRRVLTVNLSLISSPAAALILGIILTGIALYHIITDELIVHQVFFGVSVTVNGIRTLQLIRTRTAEGSAARAQIWGMVRLGAHLGTIAFGKVAVIAEGDPAIPEALCSLRSSPTLGDQPLSVYRTFLNIRAAILASAESAELAFENIHPTVGSAVYDALLEDPDIENLAPRMTYNSSSNTSSARVMPVRVLDVPQAWLAKELRAMCMANFLSGPESNHFDSFVGTSFQDFVAPYAGSRKHPDWALIPNADALPSIVAESGWSDCWPKLITEMEMWLQGGRPNVQLVLLFKWSKRVNNNVVGEVRLYHQGAAGNSTEKFRASIFPIGQDGPAGIPITRGEIFGVSGVFPGQNATNVWTLSITRLQ